MNVEPIPSALGMCPVIDCVRRVELCTRSVAKQTPTLFRVDVAPSPRSDIPCRNRHLYEPLSVPLLC